MRSVLCAAALAAAASASGADPVRLLDEKADAEYRAALPKTADGRLRKLAEDPRTLFYDEGVMPRVHQDWRLGGVGSSGVLPSSRNVSANPTEPFGNVNREFPWRVTAGLDGVPNVRTYKFVNLPAPVVYWRERMADYRKDPRTGGPVSFPAVDAGLSYRWLFPDGAVVGEALQVRDPDGTWRTFEARLRTKVDGVWRPEVYRPFEVTLGVAERPGPLRRLADRLRPAAKSYAIRDNLHPIPALSPQAADEWVLPDLTPAEVREILAVEFKPVRGGAGGVNVTSRTAFNVVPKDYAGGYHPVTQRGCTNCHDTTFKPAENFDPTRDWYGRSRGDDNVFSFHPFAAVGVGGGDPGLNPVLVRGGIVKRREDR